MDERAEDTTLSVCVVTYERPAFVERCLESLRGERAEILDVVVVDASAQARRPEALRENDTYVHAPELAGWMTRSRNRALLHARGAVIAFLDDDVVVHPGWASRLREAFRTTDAAAIAGRTLNGRPGEETYDAPVGRLLPDGRLTEGFAADRPQRERVDHGIGANMSFRRSVLAHLGGFRDDYPGTALREDTDIFLRVRRLGLPAYFDPAVVVDHLPAPHVKGARFDTRYKLYGRRNHMVLLARDAGMASPALRRWAVQQVRDIGEPSGARARIQRAGVVALGLGFGAVAMLRQARLSPTDPVRRDAEADRIRRALTDRAPDRS